MKTILKPAGVLIFLITCINGFAQDKVKMTEEPITITTYEAGKPDKNPIFYNGRKYQGAQGKVYPYPLYDNLTDNKIEKEYTGLFLENEYIKICILPEIGGRLYYAKDKSNDYNFIYHNEQIKPALIGMTGAWISGGIEWNIPHHHRATSFTPVDYSLEENADGSKTIWVGEIEWRHRMKWMVGYTMYPEKSYFETKIKLQNRTALAHSFLIWANTAVHANENYQVVFPPTTQYATFHAKNDFTEWPISHQNYVGNDFTSGVDVSWWKNHPRGISFFAWNSKKNFLGGIDHGKNAGISIIGDHHTVAGKKLWNWGTGPNAQMWYDILSDTGGPYIELMTGAFSDNQPDYSWVHPYMEKQSSMFFYPNQDLSHIKAANLNASLNLEIQDDGQALVEVIPTTSLHNARIILSSNADRELINEQVNMDPANAYTQYVKLPDATPKTALKVKILAADGEELISYQPVNPEQNPMPDPVERPDAPENMHNVEELYKAGLRLEQFYNASVKPDPYYKRALAIDPGNIKVNTQMGLMYLKDNKLKEAEAHLRRAKSRLTKGYTSPKEGEALYYLGVTLKRQGKLDEAYDLLYKATWNYPWHSPGHYLMAEIKGLEGAFTSALSHLEKCINTNNYHEGAYNLKASLLRKQGKLDESVAILQKVLENDALNHWANHELYRIYLASGAGEKAQAQKAQMQKVFRNEVENYLELANDYGNAGLFKTAGEVLTLASQHQDEAVYGYPMVYYYAGYFAQNNGESKKAAEYFEKGSNLSVDYCFPHRFEGLKALNAAIAHNSKDAKAHYYKGNIWYNTRPEKAMAAWEKAVNLKGDFSIAHRNLGFAYANVKGAYDQAVTQMELAIEHHPQDPRHFFELDQYYERTGKSPAERLALLKEHHQVVSKSDNALTREIMLHNVGGNYEKAIDLLAGHHFRKWEGVGNIHDHWVDAHLLQGQQHLSQKKYPEALQHFEAALTYPRNLEIGGNNREKQTQYFIGLAYEGLGDETKAEAAFQKAVAEEYRLSPLKFFQALAYNKLGEEEKARLIFNKLIEKGHRDLHAGDDEDFFAAFSEQEFENGRKAEAWYLKGLGYWGMEQYDQAADAFEKMKQFNPAHLNMARFIMDQNI